MKLVLELPMRIHQLILSSLLFGLWGCDNVTDSSLSSTDDALVKRSHEIFEELVGRLDESFPLEKGSIWSTTTISLANNWIVQGPDKIWGVTEDQIPTTLDCDPNAWDCDKAFKRQVCDKDADCRAPTTNCLPLEASVSQEGQSATKMCLGMGDDLLDRFYKNMTAANHELDFVSLSPPTGRFYTAMINALALLSQRENSPRVRLLFSGDISGLAALVSTETVLKKIMTDIELTAPQSFQNLRLNLAWLANIKLSWNHAKIIVADGSSALMGGHNFWDDQYLSDRRIFDLSMEYRGEGASKARDFVNALWAAVDDKKFSAYPADSGRIPNFTLRSLEPGSIETIAVGRLGAFGSNVSEKALEYLIDSAKTSVSLVQQDVFNVLPINLPLFRTFAFDSIIKAADRGVAVKMVLSNPKAYQGYSTLNEKEEYKIFVDALTQKLRQSKGLSKEDAQQLACGRLAFAPFRFSRHVAFWPSKKEEQPGLHAKFVMVDDAAFYIGSHNLYPSDLQEFGNIVLDAESTRQIRQQYWDKVWAESETARIECPY
jgi:hypothetical protein